MANRYRTVAMVGWSTHNVMRVFGKFANHACSFFATDPR